MRGASRMGQAGPKAAGRPNGPGRLAAAKPWLAVAKPWLAVAKPWLAAAKPRRSVFATGAGRLI